MRYSSVKTIVATLSIVVSLTVAAPAARAAGTRSAGEAIATRDEPRGVGRVERILRRFLNRLAGGISTNELPTPPLPPPSTSR
jgi:hypothetical protein